MSLRLAALNAVLRLTVKPQLRRTTDPVRARRAFELSARLIFPRGPAVEVAPISAGVPLMRFSPRRPQGDGAILYCHGGAFIAGSTRTHHALIAGLAAATGRPVYAPDYRLAPEHPFPAAWDDVRAAWDAVRAQGHPGGRIVLGGDSAGGGLAVSLLSTLLQDGVRPAGAFAFSPWTDLSGSGPSWRLNARREVFLPVERLADLTAFVLAGHPADDPRASPLHARFPGCPPLFLCASESECLRDDMLVLAERLRSEGAEVAVVLKDGLPHAWPAFAGLIPEAVETIGAAAAFVRRILGPVAPPSDAIALAEGSGGS